MEGANTRKTEMVLVVVGAVAMAACGSGSQERGHVQAYDSANEVRNVIPATAAAILEQADHFELLSLNPNNQQRAAEGYFHGYRVLGTAAINDTETRKKLVSAFKKAVAENRGIVAMCFNPRHGIRVSRNEKHEDFVICFECYQVQMSGEVRGGFLITGSAQPLFDSVLHSSGVPVVNPRQERQLSGEEVEYFRKRNECEARFYKKKIYEIDDMSIGAACKQNPNRVPN